MEKICTSSGKWNENSSL